MTDFILTPRLDAFFTLCMIAVVFIAMLLLAWGIVSAAKWSHIRLEKTRPPMATRLPRGERSPDALKAEMDSDYEEATRRGYDRDQNES